MTHRADDTLDPRLAVFIAAPFDRLTYVGRVGHLVARYEKLVRLASTPEPREAARLKLELLHAHPSALKESAVVDHGVLVERLHAASEELRLLRMGAPLPAPVEEPARTRVLAFADVEWLMRELKLVRRHVRRRPPQVIVARYGEVGRADPLPAMSEDLVRAIALVPRGRLLRTAARIAGARHGVTGVRELLVPAEPAEPAPPPAKVRVCHRGEVVEGQGLKVHAFGRTIALFQDVGEVCAIDDTCPHRGGPLHQGDVERGAVLCPLHSWAFDLRTGVMRGNPRLAVPVYEVTVEGDDVWVGPKKPAK